MCIAESWRDLTPESVVALCDARWHRWVVKRKELFEFFKLTHWPFHVWWRYTIFRLHARDKSRFLVAVYRIYMKVKGRTRGRRFRHRRMCA